MPPTHYTILIPPTVQVQMKHALKTQQQEAYRAKSRPTLLSAWPGKESLVARVRLKQKRASFSSREGRLNGKHGTIQVILRGKMKPFLSFLPSERQL